VRRSRGTSLELAADEAVSNLGIFLGAPSNKTKAATKAAAQAGKKARQEAVKIEKCICS
jgi:hypothetical protein